MERFARGLIPLPQRPQTVYQAPVMRWHIYTNIVAGLKSEPCISPRQPLSLSTIVFSLYMARGMFTLRTCVPTIGRSHNDQMIVLHSRKPPGGQSHETQ